MTLLYANDGCTVMIEATKLIVRSFRKNIVGPLDFTFQNKTIILGSNGSGKTSIVKAICGLYPYAGSLKVNGHEVSNIRASGLVAANLPEIYTIAARVNDVAEIFSEIGGLDLAAFMDFLDDMNLKNIAEKPFGSLSTGEMKIAMAAISFSRKPSVLIMDEPFENLDGRRRAIMIDRMLDYEGDVVIVTHEIEVLKHFGGYSVHFLMDGMMQGPVESSALSRSKIVRGEASGSIATLIMGGERYSIVEGGEPGEGILSAGTVDRIYGA